MSHQVGHFEAMNVVGMEFVDNGRSFRLEMVESIPPHATTFLTLKNIFGVKLFQAGGDEYPLVIVDLTWREILPEDRESVLRISQYPFEDELGRPLTSSKPLFAVHIEGDIVGDALAEKVDILKQEKVSGSRKGDILD